MSLDAAVDLFLPALEEMVGGDMGESHLSKSTETTLLVQPECPLEQPLRYSPLSMR